MEIRLEKEDDKDGVFEVNTLAFDSGTEAELVDNLRDYDGPFVSVVAEQNGKIVGHIIFTPVEIDEDEKARPMLPEEVDPVIYGLGPMAVRPDLQRTGIGSALVYEGLERCIDLDIDAVVVIGHPQYYPRFGFVPGSSLGLRNEFGVPDDVFMALELNADCLNNTSGIIRYNPCFTEIK